MVNDSEHRRKPPPRQAAIRAEIAANRAACEVIRVRMCALERAFPRWPVCPEWRELSGRQDALIAAGQELSKQLAAAMPHSAAYGRDAEEFYFPGKELQLKKAAALRRRNPEAYSRLRRKRGY
jgi:hypothetical protein